MSNMDAWPLLDCITITSVEGIKAALIKDVAVISFTENDLDEWAELKKGILENITAIYDGVLEEAREKLLNA